MNIGEELKKPELSVAEIKQLQIEAGRVWAGICERLEAIERDSVGTQHGPQRKRALETGTVEDIKALDDEYDSLQFRRKQVEAQRAALGERKKEALGREAVESMPAHFEELSRKVAEVEAAQRALSEAWQELDRAYQAAWQARVAAINERLVPDAGDAATMDRLMSLRGSIQPRCRVATVDPVQMGRELGVDRDTVNIPMTRG